ncbi:SulP family inorganic anion transporter [Hespellia stercorisuis]|uniref:High affinity sulphate transporter 1 n=1 Tax=Hespellia stercorisuis DSM 15480 TaxID=1121950 RepID=A0A1M6R2R3_9FIRM|nr:SulP family inorganic anion transporter [Hespellia stercorisuis]SHK26759.1 high affinity sulphate transporter 1 [Hespellia stercorisuis DSM 15480]
MKIRLFPTLKNYDKKNLPSDILAGVIVAAISIPISMGYAQIAGLPAVYGLYGSLLPIFVFAVFSTSPQMIFGVDAAPAAILGGVVAAAGVTAGSAEAVHLVPVITFFTAVWLFLFSAFKAGRLVKYISAPVMGGFISGIGVTIILMQLPKLYGGRAGTGELVELVENIGETVGNANLLSLALGVGTLAIILFTKRINPKIPMAVVMMAVGAGMQLVFHLDEKGVALLPAVERGLPHLAVPETSALGVTEGLGMSLAVAIVILAETLLSSNNFAMKNDYKLKDNQEIFTYAVANAAGAFTGCCVTSGSVSRTVMAEQYGAKTQLMSIVASVAMGLLLLFGTGFIGYLPVPVLTAIVISALISVVEADLAVRLFREDQGEFKIFMGAFLGVLVLGTIYGVMLGVVLSFITLLGKAINPPKEFLGTIPGHTRFYSLRRNRNARPIRGVVIYRFSGNLFFANVDGFQNDIERSIREDTKVVIVDASGMTSIDITAADRLKLLNEKMKKQRIRFYITEHIGEINDQFRKMGCGHLVEDGVARRTISLALADAGYIRPYPTEGETQAQAQQSGRQVRDNFVINEFEWAFGKDAGDELEKHVQEILKHAQPTDNREETLDALLHESSSWHAMGSIEEDDLLQRLEQHLPELAHRLGWREQDVDSRILMRRHQIEERLERDNPELYGRLREHRKQMHRGDDGEQKKEME